MRERWRCARTERYGEVRGGGAHLLVEDQRRLVRMQLAVVLLRPAALERVEAHRVALASLKGVLDEFGAAA